MEQIAPLPADDAGLVRVNAPQSFFRGFIPAARDIWHYRELLGNLVRKELKVKYKDSTLGFLWTLARPTLSLAVYFLVFGKFLRVGLPNFPIYIFSGLVAWDLFASTLGGCTTSIVNNSGLVKKVYFPREILPLAAVGAGIVNFALQLVVLAGVMLVSGYDFVGVNLAVIPLAFVALVLFASAVGLLLAAANVYFRDIQHLLDAAVLLLWFWITPIVYPVNTALNALRQQSFLGTDLGTIYLLNPMANIVIAFQRGIYRVVTPVDAAGNRVEALYPAPWSEYLLRVGAVAFGSLVLLWLAQRIFARAQGNFAQEL